MPDWITLAHKAGRRLLDRKLFDFRPELYRWEGIETDPVRERQSALGRRWGTRLFSKRYPGIRGRIHMHDSMLQNDSPEEIAHYRKVGDSAMANIETALGLAGKKWDEIHACLDMACGYGRVLRRLCEKIPPARITACEVTEEAVRFCSEEFGVKPLFSQMDLRKLTLTERYDLIWVGSLFTHLPPVLGTAFMKTLYRTLNEGGVLIFSTQGPSCLEHIPFYGFMFEDKRPEFEEQLDRQGAAFLSYYPHWPEYGITLYRPEHIRAALADLPEGRELGYLERGWDDHQDIWVYRRE